MAEQVVQCVVSSETQLLCPPGPNAIDELQVSAKVRDIVIPHVTVDLLLDHEQVRLNVPPADGCGEVRVSEGHNWHGLPPVICVSQNPCQQANGASLIERAVLVAALRGLDAGVAASLTRARLNCLTRRTTKGGELVVRIFGIADSARIAVVDEDRCPLRLMMLWQNGDAAHVAPIAEHKEGQKSDQAVLRCMQAPSRVIVSTDQVVDQSGIDSNPEPRGIEWKRGARVQRLDVDDNT